ncbi:pig-N [Schizosaccharomyces japonicus yFS275]|uniref:GPI ethanolamine phosphate transferase 1 n=1 Tax=Schizosaccharomyces japonicus (strain yFS275 / FY16936) TaxID=402676 RepID=B6K636_SCHJY|nr:pig-N [Schizosaccharomyces japonicus yFS275]EEB08990.1 pig-N [Schizosaccharomyces japonicus yFS275]
MLGRLLLLGILFHVIYLKSIFDIYFVTPLVHGMQQYAVEEHPAKRLFLVVGDGLRADKLLQKHPSHMLDNDQEYAAPFLRSIILNNGSFGISHTRVPTESRPGHVAIIAGFYEDVSAVTKGWKMNPVNFDSVFNQSRHTYSFGSPDILPMFAHGASDPDRVDAFMYPPEYEDFSASGIVQDEWVFEHVEQMFNASFHDPKLWEMLHQDKLVFFLHLLGIDTVGHSKRPYSKDYVENIQYVDTNLQRVVEMVNKYYEDDKATSWVFTADHGMSDYGSHGDGSLDNTRTPLIAWGAGIRKPIHSSEGHDGYSRPWGLDSVKRLDVKQADIAPLMSYLLGLNFPSNSVGEIPLDFLDCDDAQKAKAAFVNALVVGEQYHVKSSSKAETQFYYKPYPALANYQAHVQDFNTSVHTAITEGRYGDAIAYSLDFTSKSLDGLRYLQRYDWFLLRTIVLCGYVGWILYILCSVFAQNASAKVHPRRRTVASTIILSLPSAVLYVFFYLQKSPLAYYLYLLFPTLFVQLLYTKAPQGIDGFKNFLTLTKTQRKTSAINTICGLSLVFVFLESVVASYFHRNIYSVYFILLSLWPWVFHTKFSFQNKAICALWSVFSLTTGAFTLLPAEKIESPLLIDIGGIIMLVLGVSYIIFSRSRLSAKDSSVPISQLILQCSCIFFTSLLTKKIVNHLQNNLPVLIGLRVLSFALLCTSFVIPFASARSLKHYFADRLVILFLMICPTLVFFTISFESLFNVSFFMTLCLWMELETRLKEAHEKKSNGVYLPVELSHIRTSMFFYIFIQVAFFGTGNVASISSFSLDSVKRLIPVFNPFVQGAILILIIIIPFVVLSAVFGIMNERLGRKQRNTFFIAMAMADVVTINFFYLVRDEGSWLEIGISISHFCISNFLVVFFIALEHASILISKGVYYKHPLKIKKDL